MSKMKRLLLPLCLCCCLLTDAAGASRPVVVGYLPEYRLTEMSGRRLHGISDLVLFSLRISSDGKLDDGPFADGHRAALTKLRRGFQGRVLLTVGGWNRSAGFALITANAERRRGMVERLVELCREHRLSGIDFDWEHPKGRQEISNYAALIRETRLALAAQRGVVTVAQAGWQDLGKAVYEVVDRVHLMAYDHPFPQATFEKAKADVDRLIGFGCPRAKIVLGLPFYGRNRSGDAKTYSELLKSGKPDTSDLREGYALNGPATIVRKLDYAQRKGLAGLMIWELGQDKPGAGSLLGVLRSRLDRNATDVNR